MDTRKLDSWAEKLLDTGKGNNMINFRDSKSLSVEVLIPSAGDVFKKIDSGAVLEVVDPKIPDEDDDIIEETDNAEDPLTGRPRDKKAEYISVHAGRIKKQSQILVFNQSANPLNAVKNIFKKSSQAMEDTGVNVVYMAFGFIHWKESDSSHITFRAPVLLVPVKIEHESAGSSYHIKSTGDDVIVNPTFTYKLDAEYGIRLPE